MTLKKRIIWVNKDAPRVFSDEFVARDFASAAATRKNLKNSGFVRVVRRKVRAYGTSVNVWVVAVGEYVPVWRMVVE